MCQSSTVFLSVLPLCSHIKRNVPFLFLRELLLQEKSSFKSIIIALHSSCPLSFSSYITSLPTSHILYMYLFLRRKNNLDRRKDLPAYRHPPQQLITTPFVATVRSQWVSSSECETPRTGKGHLKYSGKVDSCTAFGILSDMLLACLPPSPDPALLWEEC